MNPLDVLFPPETGSVPAGEALDALAAPSGSCPALREITYTWREGQPSLEVQAGRPDRLSRKDGGELRLIPAEGGAYPYALWLPEGCDPADSDSRWPLVLFFHGIGERGSDPAALLRHGPPRYVKEGGRLRAILAAPQCPADSHWTEGESLDRLTGFIDGLCRRLPVDQSRIFLMGLSMGARCVWKLALAQPGRFAAAAVACGRTESYDFAPIRDMPLWLFHGTDDQTIPFLNARQIVTMLCRSGHRYFKLTAYPGVGHDCWTDAFGRTDVYDWLLVQCPDFVDRARGRLSNTDPKQSD